LAPGALQTRMAIAERRMADACAKRATEAALARAQWLAGIGETALAVQHEINNPLTALLGNVALLTHRLATPEEEHECMAVIAEQGMRIAAVVKRLAMLREPKSVEYVRGSRMIDLSVAGGEQ
jgi:C4-dicarboxylate-specific signal transduction histidine kinase